MIFTTATLVYAIVAIIVFYFFLHKNFPIRNYDGSSSPASLGLVDALGINGKPKSAGVDIIFVHGLGADPAWTWRAAGPRRQSAGLRRIWSATPKDVCWVTDFLPHDLRNIRRDRDRIFFYNYNATWYRDAVRVQLLDNAEAMLYHLRRLIRSTPGKTSRKLVFVGHSYGGLVIKQALTRAEDDPAFKDIPNLTKAVLCLGSPHRGTDFSAIGLVFALLLRPFGADFSMLLELNYWSTTLLELDYKFQHCIRKNNVRVIGFYETKKTQLISMLPLWSWVVPKSSAIVEGSVDLVRNISLPLSHGQLNKFGERDSQYKAITRELFEVLQPLPHRQYLVPRQQVETYTSRLDHSSAAEEFLLHSTDDRADTQTLILHGLGGAGKTQLALNLVERHKLFFNPILWIDARSSETIKCSFERCARDLDFSLETRATSTGRLRDQPAIDTIITFLEEQDQTNEQWLLVLDNADDDNSIIRDIIPSSTCGNIIVTSRHPHLTSIPSSSCQRVEIGELTPAEARHLLLDRFYTDKQSVPSDQVYTLATKIVTHLGRLALAVDLAAAYVVESHFSGNLSICEDALEDALQEYLRHFSLHQSELLRWPSKASQYDKTVWTVWDITLQDIETKFPTYHISKFLTLLATIDRTSIEPSMFRRAATGLAQFISAIGDPRLEQMPLWLRSYISVDSKAQWDDFYFKTATDLLNRYHILQWSSSSAEEEKSMSMHRLVQWWARQGLEVDSISRDAWGYWLVFFFSSIAADVVTEKDKDLVFGDQYFRHMSFATVFFSPTSRLRICPNSKDRSDWAVYDVVAWNYEISAWDLIAGVCAIYGRVKMGKHIDLEVLQAWRRFSGSDDPAVIEKQFQLATFYALSGEHQTAQDLMTDVTTSKERDFGAADRSTLNSMNLLATIYIMQDKIEEAAKIQKRTVHLCVNTFGVKDPLTLKAYAQYAGIVGQQGDLVKAYDISKWVYFVMVNIFGEQYPDALLLKSDVAQLTSTSGDHKEALRLELEVLVSRLDASSPFDKPTMLSIFHLAAICKAQGSTQKATEYEQLYGELLYLRHQSRAPRKRTGADKKARQIYLTVIDEIHTILGATRRSKL